MVTNPDGQSVTKLNAFTITNPAPTVISITPSSAVNTSPVNITSLAGTGFINGTTITLTKTGQPNITATEALRPLSKSDRLYVRDYECDNRFMEMLL